MLVGFEGFDEGLFEKSDVGGLFKGMSWVLGFGVETGVVSGIRREVLFKGDVLLHVVMGDERHK